VLDWLKHALRVPQLDNRECSRKDEAHLDDRKRRGRHPRTGPAACLFTQNQGSHMDYGKTLPMTGAGITLGGIFIGQLWLVIAAVALVAVGAVIIRLTFRRGRDAGQS